MTMQEIIAKRRDGLPHSEEELRWLVGEAVAGKVPDYQVTAWLMAAYLNPLSPAETTWLTVAMAESGDRLDLTSLPHPWVDKHSTGGVGDKTTVVLLPLLAACGLTLVKMSGRGLGITGGTVDKLQSVPGFRMDLTPGEMLDQARRIGLAITGQTKNLAPADKIFYTLRDATATVGSIPLIVSSILSKKLAGGAEVLVLDVKCGSGAFEHTLEDARALASALANTAKDVGLETHLAITDMSQPLGRAVGNALEIREAIEVLQGAKGRFYDLCVALAGHTLLAAKKAPSAEEAELLASQTLASGKALLKAKEWFAAQGAVGNVFDNPAELPTAVIQTDFASTQEGWVERIDAGWVGQTVVALGGGRQEKDDTINPSVGVEVLKSIGDRVVKGESIFRIHASSPEAASEAAKSLANSVVISAGEVVPVNPVLEIFRASDA